MEPLPLLDELTPLEELPLECWIAIALQSSDRHGLLTSVPLVSRRLAETLHDPWLRCNVLRAIYRKDGSAALSIHADGSSVSLRFKEQLAQRADLSRWRQAQLALMHSSIKRQSLRTVRQTLADGLDAEQADAHGVTPLFLSMKHNNAEALALLLGVDVGETMQQQIRLPAAYASCLALEIPVSTKWALEFIGSKIPPALYGYSLLQLTQAGVDTPGCCPLLTGVLHHSTEAVEALLRPLLANVQVTIVSAAAGTTADWEDSSNSDDELGVGARGGGQTMAGLEYLKLALSCDYTCALHGEAFQMPHFGCGTAAGHFMRQNQGFAPTMFKNDKLRRTRWVRKRSLFHHWSEWNRWILVTKTDGPPTWVRRSN